MTNNIKDPSNPTQQFIQDYMSKAESKTDKEMKIRVLITGEIDNHDTSTLISALLLNNVVNSTVINYTTDTVPDAVKFWQEKLKDVKPGSGFKIEGVSEIEVDIGDPEQKKTLVKGIFEINDSSFNGEEFESQPLKEIYGSIILVQRHLESQDLAFYTKDKDYAFWKYKYQDNMVGSPGNYIVLYGDNELEIVKDIEYLLENYRLPTLKDIIQNG